MRMRIGCGFDAHGFAPGRPLIIGGVQLPYPVGLAGHSDADVLLHAIGDALLGAAALGDLGQHFPSTEASLAGVDSSILLGQLRAKIQAAGWRLGNVDATIIAQAPKMAPYLEAMRTRVAACLEAPLDCVSLKATTTDHLGFTGRREGIAAQAVVLLQG